MKRPIQKHNKEPFKIVQVRWIDSHGRSGWHTKEEATAFISADENTNYNVGYMIFKDRKYIVLADGIDTWNANYYNLVKIPRVLVTEEVELNAIRSKKKRK